MPAPRHINIPYDLAIVAWLVLSGLVAVAFVCHRIGVVFTARLRDIDQLQCSVHDLLSQADYTESRPSIVDLLELLARYVDARQVWLIVREGPQRVHVWSEDGKFQVADAEVMTQSATRRFAWRQNRILVARRRRMKMLRAFFARYGARASVQTMLLRTHDPNEVALIGFGGEPGLRVWPESASVIACFLTVVQEALHRHRLEEDRHEMERQIALGRQMERLGVFASGIAHNLNNIINAIGGFATLAELRVDTGGAVASNLADIQLAVRRARDLVRETCQFDGRPGHQEAVVRIDTLLAETSAMLAVSLPENIMLRTEGDAKGQIVWGSFSQLQQVLLNLCNNAALAMPGGGVIRCCYDRFTIDQPLHLSHRTLDPGSYVTISIRDQGVGISAAALPQLFEPFFTTRRTGTGLGLSTAREIMEQHGGVIDVRSMPGAGSSFTLFLPLTGAKGPAGSLGADRGNGKRVLIMNADPARLALDEEVIAALGYEPHGLTDPALLGDVDGEVDAVLVAGFRRAAIMRALDSVQATGWHVPLLVAAARPNWVSGGTPLHYPLCPGNVSRGLSRALSIPADRRLWQPASPPGQGG